MNDLALEISRLTIRTMWNKQPKDLKDDLTNLLVSLFGKDTFDEGTTKGWKTSEDCLRPI